MLHRQFGHNVRLRVGGCWMNMCPLGTGTHRQITNARLQYFKDWLHSRAPTLQAVIECNLRSASLEPAPSLLAIIQRRAIQASSSALL